MIGIGFIPVVGIPLSIAGTIYKDEVMEWGRTLPPAPPMNPHNTICFVAGTPVFKDGQLVNIESINKGDYVSSYNFSNEEVELMKVNYAHKEKASNIYQVITTVDTFTVTSEHPFYVEERKWVKAKELKTGDVLKSLSDIKITIIKVKELLEDKEVYNIEVDTNNNFYVGKGKVLVHNSRYIPIIEELKNAIENEKDK